jgi:TRAP-type C4-dicarboxylate transport system permease small subunit
LTASKRLRPRRLNDGIGGRLWRVIHGLEHAGELVACLALWGIVALVFFQVLFRYILQTGLSWPDELARYLHIVVVFLTLGIVSRHRQHIRIGFFRRKLRSGVLDRFSLLIEIGAAVILAAGAIEIIRRLGGFRTPATEMPLALFFLPPAVGFAFMALESGRMWFAPSRDAVDEEGRGKEAQDRDNR